MPRVGFIVYPHALLSSIALPAEMLSAADNFSRVRNRKEEALEIRLAKALETEESHRQAPLQLQTHCSVEELGELDLLYIPALWRNPLPLVRQLPDLPRQLQHYAQTNTLICSVGTGTCFLAEAGLLDNKPATTHWYFIDTFRQRYPRVDLKEKHLITRADNLYCAGSINSVADLTGHFIDHLYGPAVARQVEGQFSPEIRRSYRDHGFFEGEANLHHDESVIEAQQWLHQHFADAINFEILAGQFGMSQRTLNRRFNKATGMSPGQFLQNLRLHHARELLRDSNLTVADIAAEVGYPDLGYFATLFRKHMAQSPSDYRKSVRGKLFSPG